MKRSNVSKKDPFDPEVVSKVLQDFHTMPLDELEALLNYRKEGVEETNMFEVLAEYDRKQKEKKDAERAA